MNTHIKVRTAAVILGCAVVAGALGTAPAAGQPTTTGPAAPSTSAADPSAPFTTPDTSDCPNQTTPPPPVDESETPQPDMAAPPPLPIPAEPVGGPQLGTCDAVVPPGAPELPAEITAASWIIADLDTGAVLAAKDPHARHRPASTIKTLLAVVALDQLRPETTITGTLEDANIEGSRAGIGPGGTYTNKQLFQALLMSSGNDAANAIATQLGGVPQTVALMNERARELGAFDTRTATPSGLDGPGMSASAYDLALIFQAGMSDPTFREIVGTVMTDFPGYPGDPTIPGDPERPGFAMANDNMLLQFYEGAIGGKTGFTDNAHHTFVGAAERDGRRLVVVLLRGEITPKLLWQQAADLLDYGFALDRDASVGDLVSAAQARELAAEMEETPPPVTGTNVALPEPDSALPDNDGGPSVLMMALLGGGGLLIVALFVLSYLVRREAPRRKG